ncbi:MAG: hypothetical protein ACXAB4_09915 [Candidatus Hodarchaeales archaeon]|jgi:hypothetical protein
MITGSFRGVIILAVMTGFITVLLVSGSGSYAHAALITPFHSTDDSHGPAIQNVSFAPENLTTTTELVLVTASIADANGISWVRVFACLADEDGFQLLCLPPQEMAAKGNAWEAEVQIRFATVPGDHVGFNITALNNLGNANTHYTLITVGEGSFSENGTTTNESGVGIWVSLLGLAVAAIGIIRIRNKKGKAE